MGDEAMTDRALAKIVRLEAEAARLREELEAARAAERARDAYEARLRDDLVASRSREKRAVGLLREARDLFIGSRKSLDPREFDWIVRSVLAPNPSTPAPEGPPK